MDGIAEPRWWIGLACDPAYAEHTAVVLASIDANGQVPEAGVMVAGFGLSAADKELLRVGAGRLARHLRIVDVTADMLGPLAGEVAAPRFPTALLGRFVIPGALPAAAERLVQIDSDTIVNASLRPLFQLRMADGFLAACHDVPRHDDPDYFNAGVMVIDLDPFRRHAIAARCLQWLADREALPRYLDQDALNVVVGHIWHRLDHRWNFHLHHAEQRPVNGFDYERAHIAHFAAHKP